MKAIILDTNILIDHVHGFNKWLDVALRNESDFKLVLPAIVVSEYFASQETRTVIGEEKSREYLALFNIQDFNQEIAYILGGLLREKAYASGVSMGDLIIAATALYLNEELATNNKTHFAGIPDLRFFDPEKIRW